MAQSKEELRKQREQARAEALRANLKRRKAQAVLKSEKESDETSSLSR